MRRSELQRGAAQRPYITVVADGTHREIGRAIGEAARDQVIAAIEWYEENIRALAGMEWAEAVRRSGQYLTRARRHLGQYVEELAGVAEGAGLSLEALAVPNCGEELTCHAQGPSPMEAGRWCTAIAVAANGRHIVGQNIDWYAVDLDKNVLFDVTNPSGVRFLTLTGVPYLPCLGMNSAGITYAGNSVFGNDERMGIPNLFIRRWTLEAGTVDEGCRRARHPRRARGSNHLFADMSGRIADLETSATAFRLSEEKGMMVHTNHYVYEDMLVYEGSPSEGSRLRLERARELLANGLQTDEDPLQLVMRVLANHAEGPASICCHPAGDPAPTDFVTVGSIVCDLDNGRLYACVGPPCMGAYREHSL